MNKHIKSLLIVSVSALIGGLIGYSYYHFYGCTNGCSITGSPINSTLYFAFIGFLLPGLFKKKTPVTSDRIE
ncbi:MAG: hypothetical protein WED33_06870 [Bacteroidia bacterium]